MSNLPEPVPHDNKIRVGKRLKAATGTEHPGLQEALVRQVQETMPASSRTQPAHSPELEEAAVVALMEMRPQNTIQGMLAGEFVALYFASMDCLRRAATAGDLPAVCDMFLNQGMKLSAASLRVLDAFERIQGRSAALQPRGHFVNVEPGGQAVVGVQVGMAPAGAGDVRPGADPAPDDERIGRSPEESERDERGIRRG